ncbi:hypothetical protein GDO81_015640 [Engystomops pustulosus]|uniref:Uncharacterized protein n=1 Tax=Engystomops pustulosus TaxID=76066 RepID=A0AAV7AMB0_ENGPU|nr:hypothetical protein GDO81_015640 [Engystomops pustulosus]
MLYDHPLLTHSQTQGHLFPPWGRKTELVCRKKRFFFINHSMTAGAGSVIDRECCGLECTVWQLHQNQFSPYLAMLPSFKL